MSFSEEIHQKIQRYLDQELTGKELAEFEQAMVADKELAREVALHKDMEELLADTPENKLRQSLQTISDQTNEEDAKPDNPFRYLLWLIPVFLILAGWWFWGSEKTAAPIENIISEEEMEEPTLDPEVKDQIQETEEESQQKVPESQKKEMESDDSKPSQNPSDTPRPIAANFEPNPAIEFLIENNVRDSDFELVVETKPENITKQSQNEVFKFQFKGVLKTTENLLEQDFKLHLFSNSKTDFQDFQPLSTSDLTLDKLADDTYRIDFLEDINLKPGLYYYILEDFTEEKIYFVEKFRVTVNGGR